MIILYGTDDNTKKEIEVKGRVVDEKGEPLPGATVKVKDEPGERGVGGETVTGRTGISLKVPNNKAVLEISFVGYVSQTIPVANAEALKKDRIERGGREYRRGDCYRLPENRP